MGSGWESDLEKSRTRPADVLIPNWCLVIEIHTSVKILDVCQHNRDAIFATAACINHHDAFHPAAVKSEIWLMYLSHVGRDLPIHSFCSTGICTVEGVADDQRTVHKLRHGGEGGLLSQRDDAYVVWDNA